ncbi:hypothetical protein G7046_g7407 [Stylonectria norvegica]|nr:hypothetical protein G7046_g7407 [Stylonectria norvegica]
MYTSTLFVGLLAVAQIASSAKVVDDSQCDCYLTNGTKPTYYKSHMFWDFRSLSKYAKVPGPLATVESNRKADFSSTYFNWDNQFGQTWGVQNWDNNQTKPYVMINSKNNVYIEHNADSKPASDTFMTMRTVRHSLGFQSAAEIESVNTYQYASMRYFARSRGSAGACTSMFTYRGAEKLADVQEADIEFLTRENAFDTVHYTNQPSYTDEGGEIPEATVAGKMPNGKKWNSWAAHRMDWTPKQTVWSVDGKQTAAISFQVPKDPASLTFNAWSDGGVWTGVMAKKGMAYQNIQWVEILYGLSSATSCKRVCSVDKTTQLGKPVLL